MTYAPDNILNIIRPYTGEYAKDHRDLFTGRYFKYCKNVCRTRRKYLQRDMALLNRKLTVSEMFHRNINRD